MSNIERTVAVFIDASNIFHAQKHNGWKIDYIKLADYLDSFGKRYGRYYFTPAPPYHDTKAVAGYREFKKSLIFLGFTVIDKELKEIKTKNKHGNVDIIKKADLDMEMGQWMSRVSKLYDTAIIMGGDSDYAPVLQSMVLDGKYIIVINNANITSIEIRNIAHEFIDLNSLKEKLAR